MTIAIEVPPEYGPSIRSGEKTVTHQTQDELKIGDTTSIISGSEIRRIRITNKIWIPDRQMDANLRNEIVSRLPQGMGFSGAFRITYEYIDQPTKRRPNNEDTSIIAKLID